MSGADPNTGMEQQSGMRDDPCDRCGAEIHVLEPATGMKLGGGVESDDMLLCADCSDEFVAWFTEAEGSGQ